MKAKVRQLTEMEPQLPLKYAIRCGEESKKVPTCQQLQAQPNKYWKDSFDPMMTRLSRGGSLIERRETCTDGSSGTRFKVRGNKHSFNGVLR